MTLNIVLVEPEIPQNTGNISRTCAITKTVLHLVRPLGFSLEDKYLKRAGLDYWSMLDVRYYDSFEEVKEKNPDGKFFYATTKADKYYTDVKYEDNTFFVFGKETKGLSKDILKGQKEYMIKIPMKTDINRSLNLANSVNIIVYEAYRQLGFPFLSE